jgi:hypothetical protein
LTSQSTRRPEDDEDTLELELTAEEMLRLRAGNAARGKNLLQWRMALVVALIGILTAVGWRSSLPHREAQRVAPAPVVKPTPPPTAAKPAARPAPVAVPVAAPNVAAVPQNTPERQASPIRVKNPFDAKEVFEFPAGTTRAEAREKMTELLLRRALNRGSPGKAGEPASAPDATNH